MQAQLQACQIVSPLNLHFSPSPAAMYSVIINHDGMLKYILSSI